LVPDLYEMMVSGGNLIQIGEMPVFKIKGLLDEEGYYSKRIFEIIFSVMALTVLSPLMLLVAVAIKLDSPGSIFYTQKRVGKEGKIFRVYKFRTMEEDAERDTGPVLASEDDRRLTCLGRFLRRTRIDEFPQLFNVLKGEMSIIGPRPERPYFVEEYEKRIKDYKFRHLNKSGITGLAQINGFYSSDPEDKLKLDLLYNNKKSPLLDIKILLQTIKVMFLGDRPK
ncbi:MAG: sugar transferase, partial [Halanaerobiales bacterium]